MKRRATHRLPAPAPNALPIREWPLIDGAYIQEWTDGTWTVNQEETK